MLEKKKLQKTIDKLKVICKEYGMDINVKKTKVMMVGEDGEEDVTQECFTLDGVHLEKTNRFKYLGSWITENARYEDIKARMGLARTAFWQNKKL